jgi:hypothetical protein
MLTRTVTAICVAAALTISASSAQTFSKKVPVNPYVGKVRGLQNSYFIEKYGTQKEVVIPKSATRIHLGLDCTVRPC